MAFATRIRMISTAFAAEEIGAFLPASAHKTTARFHATLSIVSSHPCFVKNLPAPLARFSRVIWRIFSGSASAAPGGASAAACILFSAAVRTVSAARLGLSISARALLVRREIVRRNKAVSAAADEVFPVGGA